MGSNTGEPETGGVFNVAIVDNDNITLFALKALLEQRIAGCTVIWTEHDGRQAVDRSLGTQPQPDVLMVDMSMEGLSGTDVCRLIRRQNSHIILLGVTAFDTGKYLPRTIDSGAQGLMDKADIPRLLRAVRQLGTHAIASLDERFETSEQAHQRLRETDNRSTELTTKERELMSLCVRGCTLGQAAQRLGIADSTAKNHMSHIIRKLGVRNKVEAVASWSGNL